jgi:hypothetical protein
MKQQTKTNAILAGVAIVMIALIALIAYAVYSDVVHPQTKPQHGSYAHCEYRAAKGACGKWTTKSY